MFFSRESKSDTPKTTGTEHALANTPRGETLQETHKMSFETGGTCSPSDKSRPGPHWETPNWESSPPHEAAQAVMPEAPPSKPSPVMTAEWDKPAPADKTWQQSLSSSPEHAPTHTPPRPECNHMPTKATMYDRPEWEAGEIKAYITEKTPATSNSNSGFEQPGPLPANVQTLIKLVDDLPEGVSKAQGAQIIRLTMDAMGFAMQDVLSEAQTDQAHCLDAVRANIQNIEDIKTVISQCESRIRQYQSRANQLSEMIDLFLLNSD